jgi:branched-chain amino acid transport system permease protein
MLLGAISALGFNLFFGYVGQVNFGPIAFYGIGAYACALMEMRMGIHWLIGALVVAPLAAALVSLLISIPILRLRGHGLALGTFAFAYVMYLILERWLDLTGGGDGMLVKAPELFGLNFRMSSGLFYVVLICAIVCFIICHSLVSSKHGRAMAAIRTDEVGAAAMGINVLRYKRVIYVLSSAMLGLGGGLLSQEVGWLAPDYAGIPGNILIILSLITGGRRSNAGQVVGGFFIAILPVLLADYVEYAVVIYSIVLMIILRFMPDGIVGVVRHWLGLPVTQ